MKLKDIQNLFHEELDILFGQEEVDSFFFILMESFVGISRLQLVLEPNHSIKTSQKQSFFNALDALKKEIPVQYIIGETQFYGLPFKVNPNVLIPRPETEELVDWVIDSVKAFKSKTEPLVILDIGTGSGCIAISLAKNLSNAKVYALDVSKKAIETAKLNAAMNDVDIEFVEADVLDIGQIETLMDSNEFDVIVSNPPYVRELEKELMKSNVLNNEPHLALFVGNNNPLVFYKVISKFASKKLKQGGLLFFEINEYLGNEMIQLLRQDDFSSIKLKQDIYRKDRMISAVKN